MCQLLDREVSLRVARNKYQARVGVLIRPPVLWCHLRCLLRHPLNQHGAIQPVHLQQPFHSHQCIATLCLQLLERGLP